MTNLIAPVIWSVVVTLTLWPACSGDGSASRPTS